MNTFLRHILTGPDNVTYEPANVMALAHCVLTLAAAIAGVAIYLWQCLHKDEVMNLQAFGIGLAGVGASVSAAIVALGIAQHQRGDADAPGTRP